MTRSERTQLGWLTVWAFSGTRRRGPPLLPVLVWFLIFALACFLAGLALEIIHTGWLLTQFTPTQ